MDKLTPKSAANCNYRLKHGPALSRNELVKYLLRIYEEKKEKDANFNRSRTSQAA